MVRRVRRRGSNHPFGVRDLVAFDRISEPKLSPDGRLVVFTVSALDWEANKRRSDLWLAGTDGSNHVLLFAPNPIVGGSSLSHWDITAFPNLLMEPNISGDLTHGVDLTLAALRDIGWYADIPARSPLTLIHRAHTPPTEPPKP